jgi:hypothetical protein
MKPLTRALPLLLALGLLAGCSGPLTPSMLPEYDAPQAAADQVPEPSQLGDVDPDSTRLVGKVDDYMVFLGRGETVSGEDTLCLIYIAHDSIDQIGCGAGNGVGAELRSGVMIEAGDFSFPSIKTSGGVRAELSESVSVITPR